MIIGYQGQVGSNSEQAAHDIVGQLGWTDVEYRPLTDSANVMAALVKGEADYGVLALRNNIGGAVEETLAASKGIRMTSVGRTVLDIHHCLFKLPGAPEADLRFVSSHPQALAQTRERRARLYPQLEEKPTSDTAIAAQWLAQGLLSPSVAVVCRKETGLANGLELMYENLEDRASQTEFRMIGIADAEPVPTGRHILASRLLELLKNETLTQVSLLQSLSQGDFAGSVSVGDLKRMGNIGIGTFDKLDGELVMLEGRVYQVLSTGMVVEPPDDLRVPFADVTVMNPDMYFDLEPGLDLGGLTDALTREVGSYNPNLFYMAAVDCELTGLTVRSAVLNYLNKDEGLAEYMRDARRVFEYGEVSGTLVGLYCPPYMSGLNMPGWHLHFISDDRTVGGHVMGLKMRSGSAALDQTRGFNMILPDDDLKFSLMDLLLDQAANLAQVEAVRG